MAEIVSINRPNGAPTNAPQDVLDAWEAVQAANRGVRQAHERAVAAAEAFGIAWAKWDATYKGK